jgi:hypothetical protein
MLKLLSALVLAAFATVSLSGSHGGAMKDPKAMEEKLAACKKLDPKTADAKMIEECKKLTEAKK